MNTENKLNSLNFDSMLIISYGRSGSTLLQGILNSIDGVLIRGENNSLCYHLHKAYLALLKTKQQIGGLAQNPFYGCEQLDEEYFLNHTKEMLRHQLLGEYKEDTSIKCYGFKEIRYNPNLSQFTEYLSFLEKIFPNTCFIFNTRNKKDVLKSMHSVNFHKEPIHIDKLIDIETTFIKYLNAHPRNTFHITYEDVIGKTKKLENLYSFIGAPFIPENIDRVLSLRHSYRPNQLKIKKLPYQSKQ